MTRVLEHATFLAAAFFGTWYLLSRVDFVERLDVQGISASNEERIASFMLDELRVKRASIEEGATTEFVNDLLSRICEANGVDPSGVHVFILDRDEVNAFTLPDSNIILTTAMLSFCENGEEVAGVLAHELGHVRGGHVMRKMVKEVGLLTALALGRGDAGPAIAREILRTFTSTAFDREQETAADTLGLTMLMNARIDPNGMPSLLLKVSRQHGPRGALTSMLSTHPDPSDRAGALLTIIGKRDDTWRPVANERRWDSVRDELQQYATSSEDVSDTESED